MRQKYLMIRDDSENMLTIKEYAVIDKNLKKVTTANLRESDFFLMYEETYDGHMIESAIAGDEDLVGTLRTANFFPALNYATELAEAVTALYGAKDGTQTELFFDDMIPAV